jgi:acetolactate synthase-1/2/3 large subunit
MRSEGNERRASLAKQAADKGKPGAINPHYLCAEISKAIGDDAIVVNEGIRNGPIVNNQIMRTRPGSSIGFGRGLAASSGTALASQAREAGCDGGAEVGDLRFYFGNPSPHTPSPSSTSSIFTVLFDNSGWSRERSDAARLS